MCTVSKALFEKKAKLRAPHPSFEDIVDGKLVKKTYLKHFPCLLLALADRWVDLSSASKVPVMQLKLELRYHQRDLPT